MSVLIHPSSIGKIMSEPTAAAKKAGEVLSVGAKTYLKSIVREIMYDFRAELDVKYLRKGIMCEPDSIMLLNSVEFKSYAKHEGRVDTDLLTGECDILQPNYLRDIKTSWSMQTFPAFIEDAHDKDYEFQLRAYMHLYDRPLAHLDYCMVTTPEDLRKYEDPKIHEVDHIDPQARVTTISYERDMLVEEQMLEKCRAAQAYLEKMKKQFFIDHKIEG